jgi:hypothetical protein
MVQRFQVGSTNVHAGTAANRLQPFQNLNVFGAI